MEAAARHCFAAECSVGGRFALDSLRLSGLYPYLLERRRGPELDIEFLCRAWLLLPLAELAHRVRRVAFGIARALAMCDRSRFLAPRRHTIA